MNGYGDNPALVVASGVRARSGPVRPTCCLDAFNRLGPHRQQLAHALVAPRSLMLARRVEPSRHTLRPDFPIATGET